MSTEAPQNFYELFKNNSLMRKQLFKDILKIYLIIFFAAVILYFAPKFLFSLFCIITLYIFYKSQNDYFWLAFVLILTFDVAGMFAGEANRIIEIGLFRFSYAELFSIVSFLKFKGKSSNFNFFSKFFKFYLILMVLLVFTGFVVFGAGGGASGFRGYWETFILILYLPLFFTVPKIINSHKKVVLITNIFFALIFLNILGQIFQLLNGDIIVRYFLGSSKNLQDIFSIDTIIRPELGSNIRFVVISMGLFFYFKKNKIWSSGYMIIVIILCLLSTFITATRGWNIAFVFIIITSFLLTKSIRHKLRMMSLFLLFIVIFTFLNNKVDFMHIQTNAVMERLSTLELMAEGNLIAGGTSRLTTRNDKVMNVFKESPIIGVGFSELGFETSDQHVGNQTILMGGGVIEFIFFLYFIIFFIRKIYFINSRLYSSNSFKQSLLLLIPSFGGLLIIHSSSQAMFGWLHWGRFQGKILFISLLFSIYNQIMVSACNENNEIKKIKNNGNKQFDKK